MQRTYYVGTALNPEPRTKLTLNRRIPENNGLLKYENTKEIILNQKGTRMVEDGGRLTRITNDDLEKFRLNISRCETVT